MPSKSEKDLKKRVKEIQKSGTFSKPSARGRSSIESDLQREIAEVEEILAYLATYKGQHPILCDMIRKMKSTPGWVPTPADRSNYFAVMRRAKKGSNIVQETDPIRFAMSLDEDLRPSSLD